jgi:hypothetical protein
MTIEPIGAIAFIFGLLSLYLEPTFIVYVFFASTLLGAAGALILDAVGGTTIQPAHLLLGFLVVKLMGNRDIREGALRGVAIGQPGFWLLLTMLYSTLSAFVMPRLFAGQTLAFAVRATEGTNYAAPLAPTTSNLTQSIYFIGNFICFLVLYGFGSDPSRRRILARAGLACVILNLVFVVLDLVTYATGTVELLAFIRNSTYSMLSDTEIAGLKRIVGSFVEASQFSYWTLGYFAFTSSLWLYGIAPRLNLTLSLLTLTALILSTSTTAYVGLALFLFVRFVSVAVTILMRPAKPQMFIFVIGAPIVFSIIVLTICLNDTMSAYVGNILDTMVVNKMTSASGVERSSWNAQAIQNFFDTFGFGAGNGSVRASSFPIAVISSLGVIGTITYGMFLLSIWFGRRRPFEETPADAAIPIASRSACLAWLIAASTSSGFIDLGLPFFAFAALACARPRTFRLGSPVAFSKRPLEAVVTVPRDI